MKITKPRAHTKERELKHKKTRDICVQLVSVMCTAEMIVRKDTYVTERVAQYRKYFLAEAHAWLQTYDHASHICLSESASCGQLNMW